MTFEFFDDEVLRRANAMSFGAHQLPTFDLAHARYVIAFGADFLGTWNSPLAQSVAYGRMRQGQGGVRAEVRAGRRRACRRPAPTRTNGCSRSPGTEGVLALGLAHVIMKRGLRQPAAAGRAGALMDTWASGLPAFTPEAVEQQTGVKAARVERLAVEFAAARSGRRGHRRRPLAHTNGLVRRRWRSMPSTRSSAA